MKMQMEMEWTLLGSGRHHRGTDLEFQAYLVPENDIDNECISKIKPLISLDFQ